MTERHDSPTPLLRLHLLDGFRAIRDGGPEVPQRWSRPSARSLVKLLAVTPEHRLHREQVMELCWPDTDAASAQGSLRVALHAARHALEPELAPRASSSYLLSQGPMLLLDPQTVWIDVDRAEAVARAALAGTGDVEALAGALALLPGDLLPEDRYVPWAADRRDQVHDLREQVRIRLATVHLRRGAVHEAAEVAELVLADTPAEEAAHRILMEAYLRRGLRRRAVAQYHLCREVLDAELGVRPSQATELLHRSALGAAPAPVPSKPALPAVAGAETSPLRGRDGLLHRLLASPAAPVTMLTGEAGVGKTRLAAEAATRAAQSGAAVLWAAGHDLEGHAPYGMFTEALDRWLAGCGPAERADVGAEYPELAGLLPSLGQVGAEGDHTPEEERDRLFRATALLLGGLAREGPALIVFDDLHTADAGSIQMMSHLARRAADRQLALRFLVTCREEELAEDDSRRIALAALARHGLAVREPVDRLDRDTCLEMVREKVMGEDGAVPDRVWDLSLGNPLFALEIARGVKLGDPEAAAPRGVHDLVADRLHRIDPDARRIVHALSIAGGEAALAEILDVAAHGFDPPVVGAAASNAIERAIAASLVEERPVVLSGTPEPGLAFRHPLVRLTCYEQLSGVRRRQLHAAFAEAVLRRRPGAVESLASHFTRADDPRAAEYLRRAAERAAALFANDTADRYYRDLVARLDVDAALARVAHSQVLHRMGQFDQAADVLRLALDEFHRRGEHAETVLVAARLADTLVKVGAFDEATEVLDAHPADGDTPPEPRASHALARAALLRSRGDYDGGYDMALRALSAAEQVQGATGHGLVARSYAIQASSLGLAGRFQQASEAADQALAPAQAYGDPTLLGGVLSTLRENARRNGRLAEAVEFGERALEHAGRSGDPTAAAFERANLAELRLLQGHVDQARALADAAVAGAEWENAWCLPYALTALALVHTRTGGYDNAAALLDRAHASTAGSGDSQARHEILLARAELAISTGDSAGALDVLGGTDEGPVLRAWAHLLGDDAREAQRIGRTEADRAAANGERLSQVEAMVVWAMATHHLGDAREARRILNAAGELSDALPYPAGQRYVAQAWRSLRGDRELGTRLTTA